MLCLVHRIDHVRMMRHDFLSGGRLSLLNLCCLRSHCLTIQISDESINGDGDCVSFLHIPLYIICFDGFMLFLKLIQFPVKHIIIKQILTGCFFYSIGKCLLDGHSVPTIVGQGELLGYK